MMTATRVSSASDGASMRAFLKDGDPVDCVILDAFMPGEGKHFMAVYLKNRKGPVVVISGSPAAMRYAEENDFQLLKKPFRAQQLYSSVATTLAGGEWDSGR